MPVITEPNPLNALDDAAAGYVAGQDRAAAAKQRADDTKERQLQQTLQQQREAKDDAYRAQSAALEQARFDREGKAADLKRDSDKTTAGMATLSTEYKANVLNHVQQVISDGAAALSKPGVTPEQAKAIGASMLQKAMKDWQDAGHDQHFASEGASYGLTPQNIQQALQQAQSEVIPEVRKSIEDAYKQYTAGNMTPYQSAELGIRKQDLASRGQITPYQSAELGMRSDQLGLERDRLNFDETKPGSVSSDAADAYATLSPTGRKFFDLLTTTNNQPTPAQALAAINGAPGLSPSDKKTLGQMVAGKGSIGGLTTTGAAQNKSAATAAKGDSVLPKLEASQGFKALPGGFQTLIVKKLKGGATASGILQDIDGADDVPADLKKKVHAALDPAVSMTGGSNAADPFLPQASSTR